MKTKSFVATLSLLLVMFQALTAHLARAEDGGTDQEKPIRLYATAGAGPLGKVVSFGAVKVNGQAANQDYLLWGGEMLEAPPHRSVRVALDAVGQVTLTAGTIATLTVTPARLNDDGGNVLIASLTRGNVIVKLQERAEAYVEASGSAVTASRGANFSVGVGESGPLISRVTGEVGIAGQTPQRNYSIRPVGGRPNISVRLRQTREIQVQVTDENDRPVPDVPVIFSLGGGGATLGAAGATTVTVTTSAAGIATTTVTGTAAGATSSVTATVAGTNVSTTIGVTTAAAGIAAGTTLGIIAAAVGGGVATAVVVQQVNDDNQKKPITEARPPRVTP